MNLRRLFIRLRIWQLRRAAKWWFDDYLWRHQAIQTHQRAKPICLDRANQHHMKALALEAEAGK